MDWSMRQERSMVDIVITICELLGPAAAILIGLTLLGIGLGKIRA